ncbi:MAG: hypothetical protein FJX57_15080 [Alphaproteobacteria bacterium]|nr:hypothetical protein [Alphaproteobacteria bacterium]
MILPALDRRSLLIGLATSSTLAACQSAPPKPAFAALTYAHKGAIRLTVGTIDVMSEYVSPMRPPHIEHRMPVSPLETLRRWPADRLVAAGGADHVARYTIREASVKETALPRTQGVRGVVTKDQTERYDLALAVMIEIRQQRGGFVEASAEARVTRFRTVVEGISLADRERAWYELLEIAMLELDAELERQARSHLARYITF